MNIILGIIFNMGTSMSHNEQCGMSEKYQKLAEVPSGAWVLNGLSVNSVYQILLLYSPETPAPSLSIHNYNLLLGSLLCPLVC